MPWSVNEFRTVWGFALIGFANTILPSIVHGANYLIIPYPRHIVLLIELLPVLLTKLTLPFVIHRIPCRVRPLAVAACWFIAKNVADATPPNVPPPARIATSVLASVASAATEVSCLGTIGQAGLPGLAGWGIGTGAGLLENAVWPFFLTYGTGKVLRSGTGYVYYLVALSLVSHFLILPPTLMTNRRIRDEQDQRKDAEEGRSFDRRADDRPRSSSPKVPGTRSKGFRVLIKSDMPLLFVASGSASLLRYGLARSLDGSTFKTYSYFITVYGASLHLGTWMGRSSIRFFRVQNLRGLVVALGTWTLAAFFNAVLFTSTYIAFVLVFLIGLAGGLVYVNVLARVVEETGDSAERGFVLGLVTAGEAGGAVVGGVFGALLDMLMCVSLVGKTRWCHRAQ
ncbi:Protein BTN1-like protein 1 [Colletotrichum chlorophyti]|uniref:Protein BTN n=1 Tax=Colletotrichum chlorophyti TaxID=708187 RepID=A0A1Q8S0Q9_9PEZI|nr:Protein BTN1-like protein 1 [Colletotrichum chlorophyti]